MMTNPRLLLLVMGLFLLASPANCHNHTLRGRRRRRIKGTTTATSSNIRIVGQGAGLDKIVEPEFLTEDDHFNKRISHRHYPDNYDFEQPPQEHAAKLAQKAYAQLDAPLEVRDDTQRRQLLHPAQRHYPNNYHFSDETAFSEDGLLKEKKHQLELDTSPKNWKQARGLQINASSSENATTPSTLEDMATNEEGDEDELEEEESIPVEQEEDDKEKEETAPEEDDEGGGFQDNEEEEEEEDMKGNNKKEENEEEEEEGEDDKEEKSNKQKDDENDNNNEEEDKDEFDFEDEDTNEFGIADNNEDDKDDKKQGGGGKEEDDNNEDEVETPVEAQEAPVDDDNSSLEEVSPSKSQDDMVLEAKEAPEDEDSSLDEVPPSGRGKGNSYDQDEDLVLSAYGDEYDEDDYETLGGKGDKKDKDNQSKDTAQDLEADEDGDDEDEDSLEEVPLAAEDTGVEDNSSLDEVPQLAEDTEDATTDTPVDATSNEYWNFTEPAADAGAQQDDINSVVLTETQACVALEDAYSQMTEWEQNQEACMENPNSCQAGCCRLETFIWCDEDNSRPDLPCICNQNTATAVSKTLP